MNVLLIPPVFDFQKGFTTKAYRGLVERGKNEDVDKYIKSKNRRVWQIAKYQHTAQQHGNKSGN
jgi:hypothetical protein